MRFTRSRRNTRVRRGTSPAPIALAYCAATARAALGALPDRVTGQASGNIIKNVKSVAVPEL